MNISRRRFFGAAAGGVTAGPSVIQEAVSGGGSLLSGVLKRSGLEINKGPPRHYGEKDACSTEGPSDYLARRREELERVVRGEFDKWELENFDRDIRAEASVAANIDALKSVSPAAKLSIGRRALVEHRKRRKMEEAKRELSDLSRHLLGKLFG